jgi:hypothetical protein
MAAKKPSTPLAWVGSITAVFLTSRRATRRLPSGILAKSHVPTLRRPEFQSMRPKRTVTDLPAEPRCAWLAPTLRLPQALSGSLMAGFAPDCLPTDRSEATT